MHIKCIRSDLVAELRNNTIYDNVLSHNHVQTTRMLQTKNKVTVKSCC